MIRVHAMSPEHADVKEKLTQSLESSLIPLGMLYSSNIVHVSLSLYMC